MSQACLFCFEFIVTETVEPEINSKALENLSGTYSENHFKILLDC